MAEEPVPAAPDGQDPAWSQVWHLPVLLIGLGLLVVGVYSALPGRTANDFPGVLDEVAMYLEALNLEKAQERLDTIQKRIEGAPEVTTMDRGRFWQYWADLNFIRNRENMGLDTPTTRSNNQLIAKYYGNAESYEGYDLSHAALRRFAVTLLALDREDEALEIVNKRLADAPPRRRYEIIRGLIQLHLDAPTPPDTALLTPLIDRFRQEIVAETDPKRQLEEDLWITGVAAKTHLASGDPDRALDFLLTRLNRLKRRADPTQLAPLLVHLATAYQRVGDFDNADRYYRIGQQSVEATDPLNAEILVGLAQIALSQPGDQNVTVALEHFASAVRTFPAQPAYIEALIGAGDCEARLEAYGDAEFHFSLAVERLIGDRPTWDRRRELLTDVVRSHVDRVNDLGDFDQALAFLGILRQMHDSDMPPGLLLDFAVTNERIARARVADAERFDPRQIGDDSEENLARFHRLNRESAVYFGNAAGFYLRHGKLASLDDQSHANSMWKAAICFDSALKWDEAIDTYTEFVRTRQDDPLLLSAKSRLGKSLMARGLYAAAIEHFLELTRDHPHAIETFDSLVPLAQAYLADGQTDAAVRVLAQVVDDHPAITPVSRQYREALIELGRLYYGRIESDAAFAVPAIERLDEAVKRYADSPAGPTLRFLLADSLRKSIPKLDEQIVAQRSQTEIVALTAERNRRLEDAQVLYNQSIHELEARPEASLGDLENLYLRNSYFYQADCAFDRQRYGEAVEMYDTAARRFEHHPASLVALVQIVNARCEMGQFQEAKVANDQALWQLERIPDEAFDDPHLPMTRAHWEDWLRWTSELNLFAERDGRTAAAP